MVKKTASSVDNRALIVSAAYKLLSEEGYTAATMKGIAAAAGVAPGLIHYYFSGKDQLFQEVLSVAGDRYVKEVEQWCQSLSPQELLKTTFSEPKRRVIEQPEWFRLRCELFALGLRNPEFHESIQVMLAGGRQCITRIIRQVSGDTLANPDAISAVLLSAFDGLALQKLADPSFDLDTAYSTLLQMFTSQMNVG